MPCVRRLIIFVVHHVVARTSATATARCCPAKRKTLAPDGSCARSRRVSGLRSRRGTASRSRRRASARVAVFVCVESSFLYLTLPYLKLTVALSISSMYTLYDFAPDSAPGQIRRFFYSSTCTKYRRLSPDFHAATDTHSRVLQHTLTGPSRASYALRFMSQLSLSIRHIIIKHVRKQHTLLFPHIYISRLGRPRSVRVAPRRSHTISHLTPGGRAHTGPISFDPHAVTAPSRLAHPSPL